MFGLKQIAVDIALEKVDRYLEAKLQLQKNNEKNEGRNRNIFSGKKLAYGVTILFLVIKELNLNIERKDIVNASVEKKDDLDKNSLKIA